MIWSAAVSWTGAARAAAVEIDTRTPDRRDRYTDLVRVLAIIAVVYGHWIAAVIFVDDGRLVASQILAVEPWTQVATWFWQVMPLFFLVGGRVNAASLRRAHLRGDTSTTWVRRRSRRLLRPLLPLLAVWLPMGPLLVWFGVSPGLVELATETAFIPLWFLVVYVLVVTLTPTTLWLHHRGAYAVLLLAVGLVAVIDVLDGVGVPLVAHANYVLVFGIAHQLGYLWLDDKLPRGARGLHLLWSGLLVALLLVTLLDYPVSMVGVHGDEASNATPPTLALVALTTMQLGGVLAARRPVEAWLRRHAVSWATVATVGAAIITVFLWHMTALIIAASLTHFTGWWPRLTSVDAQWWAMRPVWLLVCTIALVPLVLLFRGFERAGDPVPRGPGVTITGVVATAVGLGIIQTTGLYDADRALGLPPAGVVLLLAGLVLLGVHHREPADVSGRPASDHGGA